MGQEAVEVDLAQKWMWGLEIDTFSSVLFNECDFPESEIEAVEFDEAGTLNTIPNPGRRKFSPITVKKGVFQTGPDDAAYNWFKAGADTDTGDALPPSQLKKDVHLHRKDGLGNIITTWEIIGAWIQKLAGEKWEAKSSEYAFESFTLRYTRYQRINGG